MYTLHNFLSPENFMHEECKYSRLFSNFFMVRTSGPTPDGLVQGSKNPRWSGPAKTPDGPDHWQHWLGLSVVEVMFETSPLFPISPAKVRLSSTRKSVKLFTVLPWLF